MLTDREKELVIEVLNDRIRSIDRHTDHTRHDPLTEVKFNLDSAVNKLRLETTIEDVTRERVTTRVDKFIERSAIYGYNICRMKDSNKTNLYLCTTKCNHCGKYFTEEVPIEVDEDNEVKAGLEIHCKLCKDKHIRRAIKRHE